MARGGEGGSGPAPVAAGIFSSGGNFSAAANDEEQFSASWEDDERGEELSLGLGEGRFRNGRVGVISSA